ncbi:unnamed protein product [Urochloa humidicola]
MGKKLLTLAISLLIAVVAMLLLPCATARPISEIPTIDGSPSVHLSLGRGSSRVRGLPLGRVGRWSTARRASRSTATTPVLTATSPTAAFSSGTGR